MENNCGDNRFEIIEKAKNDILKSTNIEYSKDEMKVLDNILFRCWQMNWLTKYDKSIKIDEEKLEMLAIAECNKIVEPINIDGYDYVSLSDAEDCYIAAFHKALENENIGNDIGFTPLRF